MRKCAPLMSVPSSRAFQLRKHFKLLKNDLMKMSRYASALTCRLETLSDSWNSVSSAHTSCLMGLFTNRYIEQLWVPQYPPIVCNLYMEDFEVKALSTAPHSPDWWFRYVDDTHIKIKKEFVGEFTNLINSLDQNIKFTSEEEKDSSLAFLDTLTIRYPDGQIKTRVYRKDTHTDQYLNFRWNHPLQHKLGVIRTLHHRAENVITDPEDKHREKDYINEALKD